MQVERVRPAGRQGRRGERDLNRRECREGVDAAGRHEFLRGVRAAQDLEQHRHRRWRERRIVDEEVRAVLFAHVDVSVRAVAVGQDGRHSRS